MEVMAAEKEIQEALFSIASKKALGSNGFSSHFFKKACSVVRSDVVEAIKDFFTTSKLLGETNATIITLLLRCRILLVWRNLGPFHAAM